MNPDKQPHNKGSYLKPEIIPEPLHNQSDRRSVCPLILFISLFKHGTKLNTLDQLYIGRSFDQLKPECQSTRSGLFQKNLVTPRSVPIQI